MLKYGDTVSIMGYVGEVIEVDNDKVLVHFGGDSLHYIQEWYDINNVVLEKGLFTNHHQENIKEF